ncbi:ADP-ribosylglycohydrolase family protein [Candidatus Sumerlaeota bacterium]|nr:ADP-ribosylglycohydrolase family protein [Candidatus Sumerlaeota bacterium]
MKQIDYAEYLDKTHGCWIGKSIGGTIGAPYEGAKELFHFEYNPEMIRNMIPNDDLDLQVLWLSVLEEKGTQITSEDLADAFLNKCPYAPGEYAIFKKNYARGVHPPVSGAYNNRYYIAGMGCPIRSEIWACVMPGNPVLASHFAGKDGVLDHAGDSVFAEQFLAGLESAAFFEGNMDNLIEIGLSLIPGDSRFLQLVRDVREWCVMKGDWRIVRELIIRNYGHPDCTNMFQNMGIALMALLLGEKDFIRTIMIAMNSGFDTDCACATTGAILGIIHGADFLMKRHGFEEQRYILGVDIKRRSDKIYDLAEDVCRMGLHFARKINHEIEIQSPPDTPQIKEPCPNPISIFVDYQGLPAIGIGDRKTLYILFQNQTEESLSGTLRISMPEGWNCNKTSEKLELAPGEKRIWEIEIAVPPDIRILYEKNILEARFDSKDHQEVHYRFGLVGATVWEAFGPFWENCTDIPELKPGESYYGYLGGKDRDESADRIRAYHLNAKADMEKEYLKPDEITDENRSGDGYKEGRTINYYEDLMDINDAVGFQGPCALYLVRRMVSPEERKVSLLIGHTDAFRLWINGKMISRRDNIDWWTGENAHVHDVIIPKGENIIIVELIRRGAEAKFSLVFTKGGACTEHLGDFGSLNPKSK